MDIKTFFDTDTSTMTYVVYDTATNDAVIIDPVLDFDPAAVKTTQQSLHRLTDFIRDQGLKVRFVLETHAHADHLSSARDLITEYYPQATLAIGKRITEVQKEFKTLLNLPPEFKTDGSQFGRLLADEEVVQAGSLSFRVIFTPGHTPACASYLFKDVLFVGDALFMPDYGTGRCDFPGGDAQALYRSVTKRIYTLPDATRVFVGHDYQPDDRPLAYATTVGDSKAKNIQLKAETAESQFVAFRQQRDATLSAPRLLFPSVQVNIAAGNLTPEANGQVYLKLPLTVSKA